jgi:hypothetical protein
MRRQNFLSIACGGERNRPGRVRCVNGSRHRHSSCGRRFFETGGVVGRLKIPKNEAPTHTAEHDGGPPWSVPPVLRVSCSEGAGG